MSLRRKTHSKYDDYFERTKECAKCLKCNKVIKLSPHSGSNNLKYHLEKEHMDLFNEVREIYEQFGVKINFNFRFVRTMF